MEIHSLLQPLQGPFHAAGPVESNKPVTVNSIAEPILKTMQVGTNYIAGKLTLNKLVKAGIAFAAVQALSSVPGADAGFALFHLCWTTCSAATGGGFIPACVAACLATLPAPTP